MAYQRWQLYPMVLYKFLHIVCHGRIIMYWAMGRVSMVPQILVLDQPWATFV